MASHIVQNPSAGCIVEFMQGNEPQIAWVMEEAKRLATPPAEVTF